MIPKAELPSCTAHRLRLRIPSRRGDDFFFRDLSQRWQGEFPESDVVSNPLTGSLLITGVPPVPDAIAEFGRRLSLFDLKPAVALSRSWAGSVEATIVSLNRKIERGSGGLLDLTSALFTALVIFGISELIRGHWKTPPWYTAFWYAFGVYSKVLLDQATAPRG